MKNSFLIIPLLFFCLFACSSDEEPEEPEEKMGSIIGKWQLFEQCSYDVSGVSCNGVNQNREHFYEFKTDSTIISNRYEEFDSSCTEGTFSINEESVYIKFDCIEFTSNIRKLTSEELILDSNSDDGGLTNKYKKI